MSHAAAQWHGTIVNTIAWYYSVNTMAVSILWYGTTVNTMTWYHCQQNGMAPLSMLLHGITVSIQWYGTTVNTIAWYHSVNTMACYHS